MKRGRPGSGSRRARAPANRRQDDGVILYGWHPVTAALANPARKLKRLVATENAAHRLRDAFPRLEANLEIAHPRTIDRMLGDDAVHQGMLLETNPLPLPDFGELARARLIVVLDQITDPHNVGAILRSAAAFWAEGLIMTARHSPPLGGVLAKSASGGLERVPIHLVRNLAEALGDLRDMGFRIIGLDSEAATGISRLDGTGAAALVLGAEGRGLRARTRSLCDTLVRIETGEAIGSLNVSNAAAVALYVLSRGSSSAKP